MATIQLKRATAANWASKNPVLLAGEPGLETDTNKIKFGNGVNTWNQLAYFAAATTVQLPSDFWEQLEDRVAGMLVDNANMQVLYNDTTGKIELKAKNVEPGTGGGMTDAELAVMVDDEESVFRAALIELILEKAGTGGGGGVSSWNDLTDRPPRLLNLASMLGAANKLPYMSGSETWAVTDLTAQARSLLDDGSASAMRTTLDVYSKAESQALVSPSSIMGVATIKGASNIITTVPSNSVEGAAAGRIAGLAVTVTGEGRPAIVTLTLPSYRHSSSLTNIGIAQGTTVLQSRAIQVADNTAPGTFVQMSVATGVLNNGTSYSFYAYGRQPSPAAGAIDSHNSYPSELRVTRG